MKKQRGITLIALVITIIILIILAGVAINLTLGERGISNKAKYAKERYLNAQLTEESELRKICFSEENMTTLAKEMYSIDDFSWMRILEERLDELLNGLV